AISHMFALAKEINVYKAQTDSGDVAPDGKLVDMMTKVFAEFCSIIGVLEGEAEAAGNDDDGGLTEQLMQLLLELRQDARKAKNYAQADAIRNKLGELGIVIEDTPQGARWKKQ
ncbi:MAG: cysteine--tRNA ligase, partial [Acidaminococcaceae bacterium]|nr:cysteine--tRNA ligase [Acidaminococcaceae bacterium]